ncbi:amidohydrolase family protein [Pseudomonadales bacterium]|nr:amidohydrolase family protein [Gammaproteobacteria bacterium]MBT5681585.1 amidohydrolase family protein [Gammaproteobacteria bacterium]MBT6025226.1 amidohydrolase family protein [Gammaproteobacteria bacterium]MDA8952851.1 amidohydrolase family protein [Pseudomonadales bacterium]
MEYDLIISGGTVIDGTGAEGKRADIAVSNGRIARIGDLSADSAAQTIDATNKVVTPGFVDLHTHLDAQVGWDPLMSSSSYHGVTTAMIGNCGVTFAPCSPKNRRYLAELMESVEDIAADAIMDGLPWDWTTYGEYLDSVQALRPALNVVGLAGHSAIRYEAMGDRSMDEGAQATDKELDHIAQMVKQSVEDGAVGFSTSRFLLHTVPDGRCTPGTWADLRETKAIQQAIVDGGGVGAMFQSANDMQTRYETELQMFRDATDVGCQVLFSGGTGPQGDGGVERWNQFFEEQNEGGKRLASLCHTRPSGAFFGLAQLSPFTKSSSAWKDLMALPTIADRVEAMRHEATRTTLIAEGIAAGDMQKLAHMLHPFGTNETPDLDFNRRASLAQLAEESGKDPVEIYVDRLLASEGREFFNYWMFGGHLENQWKYMQLPHVVPMLGDAGAHVGFFTDTDSPTVLLSELTREQGVYTLPEAIHRITGKSAEIIGLKQRGELKEGWHADINVIDYANLSTCHPEYVNDFPHGGGRFIVKGKGYAATIVAGEVIIADGQHTGNRPGQVIREFIRG